ncbi:hypothetical protein [Caulobacter segnis]|uniref:hypothetical protein n=1 Tax=Caulobacter segnis TaxID=88688 RepID=UPI0012ED7E9C|nr:hypothetical protein [Caulobacter segnis]
MEAVSAAPGQPRLMAIEQEIYASVSNATHYRAAQARTAIKDHQFQQDGENHPVTFTKHYTAFISEFIDIRQIHYSNVIFQISLFGQLKLKIGNVERRDLHR